MKFFLIYFSLVVVWIFLFALHFVVGLDVRLIFDTHSADFFILQEFRIPSAFASSIGGGLLALAGLQMQTYFRNPLAGPFVTGVSAGASLGVAFLAFSSSLFLFKIESSWLIFGFSFSGSLLIFMLVVFLSRKLNSGIGLLLVGLMITAAVSSIVQLFQLLMDNLSLRDFFIWNQGSFTSINYPQLFILLIVAVIVIILSILLIKPFDLLMLGDDMAKLRGVDLRKVKFTTIFSAALSTSVVTAFCGPIGFVGLAAPHIARLVMSSNFHRPITIACFLIGGIICMFCNVLIQSKLLGIIVPVNILTSLFGAPFVVWLILKRN
jgi:iron complex transport system permease protein